MVVWRRRILFYAGLLVLWAAVSRLGIWPGYVFPSPQDVGENLFYGILNGTYIKALAASMQRIFFGFGLSVVLGVMLGLTSSRFSWVGDTVGSLMVGLQALPSICWFPLAVLWMGLNEKAILFVTVSGALFAIATGVDAGIKSIPPLFLKAAENMGARGWTLYSRVLLPGSLPSVLTGLRQGWSFAWRSLMAGELLGVQLGLGHQLSIGRELNDVAQVMAMVLLILVIGLVVDGLVFTRVERSVRQRWGLLRGA